MPCSGRVFYISYISAELRRRKGRTLLTALGLAVGVGLVVTVTALSSGLDDAQQKVLKPLTGVGTDMSVQRPIVVSGSGDSQSFAPGQTGSGPSGPPQLSAKGSFVYVIKADSSAELRPVKLGQRQGELVVVDQGLKADERVVVTGQLGVTPGGKVRLMSPENGAKPQGTENLPAKS